MSRGIWKDPAVPKVDWFCVDFDDLGEGESRKCDACGSTALRYVHHLRHPDGMTLACGRTCAARLEGDPEPARRREAGELGVRREAVPKAGRMVGWLAGWENSRKNDDNIWKRVNGDIATVFLRRGYYVGAYRDRFTRRYSTQAEAQIALYALTVRPESALDSGNKVETLAKTLDELVPW